MKKIYFIFIGLAILLSASMALNVYQALELHKFRKERNTLDQTVKSVYGPGVSLKDLVEIANKKLIEDREKVTIFFETGTPEELIFELKERLIKDNLARSVKYISSEEAKAIFRKENLIPEITEDSLSKLPASLEISTDKKTETVDFLKRTKENYRIDEIGNLAF